MTPAPLSTLQEQKQHYAGVKARLGLVTVRRHIPRPAPVLVPVQPLSLAETAPDDAPEIIDVDYVPLNMLTMCSWRFLVALAAMRGGVHSRDILRRDHSKAVVAARYDAMALTYEHTQNSLPQIGKLFQRDHSTVIYGMQKLGRSRKLVQSLIKHCGGRPINKVKPEPRVVRLKSKFAGQEEMPDSPLFTVFTGNSELSLTLRLVGRDRSY